jgi:DNA polymerase-1
MPFSGNKKSDLLIVGEFPTDESDGQGLPFAGRYARYLDKQVLLPAGIDKSKIAFDNAVKCASPKNKKPSVGEMRNCRQYLFKTIRDMKPKVVVAMGNIPLYSLLYLDGVKVTDEEKGEKKKDGGMSGITKWRGKQLWHRDLNCWVVPAYNPSQICLSAYNGIHFPTKQTIADLELAFSLSCQKLPVQIYPLTYHITNKKEALNLMQVACQLPYFAIDTEAEGLDWWQTKLTGISLSALEYGNKGYFIDLQELDVDNVEIRKGIQNLLISDSIKVFHNSAYDIKLLRSQGFRVNDKIHDTMLDAHLLDENFYKGLKNLTWRNLNFGGYDYVLDEYRRDNKIKGFKGIPGSVLAPYAALDAVATMQLYEKFNVELRKEGMSSLSNNILHPSRKVFTGMEFDGMRVHMPRVKAVDRVMLRLIKAVEKEIYKEVGYEFNLKSGQKKQNLFFKELKCQPIKATKTGFSIDGDTLKYIGEKKGKAADIANLLLDHSYLTKQHSTFVKAILNNARQLGECWFIHTNYNTTGTATLRVSCSNPCTHNIPKDGIIKGMYIPSVGNVFVYSDIKAAEIRVLAVVAMEETLLDAFRNNIDPHVATWRLMFDKLESEFPTEEERTAIKRIAFGIIYGMQIKALARRTGKTLSEAKIYYERWFGSMKKVKVFLKETNEFLRKNGYVRTIFNSKRRFPDIAIDDFWAVARMERQAGNVKIQTPAALYTCVCLNRISVRLKKEKLKAIIVHSIHDCIIIDCPKNEVERVSEIVKEVFNIQLEILPIPMEVDTHVINSWGEGKESKVANLISKVSLKLTLDERNLLKEWLVKK